MIPGVADRALALMMRLLEDEERLREANAALEPAVPGRSTRCGSGSQGSEERS